MTATNSDANAQAPAFCDFCDCKDCRVGPSYMHHAACDDPRDAGKRNWICDVCYTYDQCTASAHKNGYGEGRNPSGPCPSADCRHRPRLKQPVVWTPGAAPNAFMTVAMLDALDDEDVVTDNGDDYEDEALS